MVFANELDGNGSQASQKKLHVVIHGLIAVHFSESERAVVLHIPRVDMHQYMGGSFTALQALEAGRDYRLTNVSPGRLRLDPERIVDDFISLSLSSKNLKLAPKDIHASFRLFWSCDLKSVRRLEQGDDPLFNEDVNPRELGYITYFTYYLRPGERPRLTHGGDTFWSAEPAEHTRLHLFADPAQFLSADQYPMHMHEAYTAFNHQLFAQPFDLMPNVMTRMEFSPLTTTVDIPNTEAVDLSEAGAVQPRIKGSGNCLPVLLHD